MTTIPSFPPHTHIHWECESESESESEKELISPSLKSELTSAPGAWQILTFILGTPVTVNEAEAKPVNYGLPRGRLPCAVHMRGCKILHTWAKPCWTFQPFPVDSWKEQMPRRTEQLPCGTLPELLSHGIMRNNKLLLFSVTEFWDGLLHSSI